MGSRIRYKKLKKLGVWKMDLCPACNSKKVCNDYTKGETFCMKCGLVIF